MLSAYHDPKPEGFHEWAIGSLCQQRRSSELMQLNSVPQRQRSEEYRRASLRYAIVLMCAHCAPVSLLSMPRHKLDFGLPARLPEHLPVVKLHKQRIHLYASLCMHTYIYTQASTLHCCTQTYMFGAW